MKITHLYQSPTYEGLMAGVPTAKMNQRLIDYAMTDITKKLSGIDKDDPKYKNIQDFYKNPIFIEPTRKVGTKKFMDREIEYEYLPNFVTYILVKEELKVLAVVMYTDELGNREEILSQLEAANIDVLAKGYELMI